jgi:hypothetical protein
MPILELVAAATAILTLGFLVKRFVMPAVRRVNQFLDWQDDFRKDWQGEPARAGRDATLGVMERLNQIDGELSRNGGTSMKDVLEKTQKDVQSLGKRVGKVEQQQQNLSDTILEKLLD